MIQPGLFDKPYPHTAGWKRTETSRAAAEAVKPRVPTLRDKVQALLKGAELTADECAAALNVTVLACRPRLSELFRLGMIQDTGRTRRNASGIQASVWRAVEKPPP